MIVIDWPQLSPVVPWVHIWRFRIHYYALAYITALIIGWQVVQRTAALNPVAATREQVDDFLTWATVGIILGGRLGYVLFYQPINFLTHPLQIFEVWDGGMSSHGGFIGVTIAIIWFCTKNHINMFRFADRISVAVPIGLFLGRLGNFINGELWGRPAAPWFPIAMIYPQSPTLQPRYPSELIEASLEGILLFVIVLIASRSEKLRERSGTLTGLFLAAYGILRIIGECFRQPDWFLGFLPFGTTMGQILSLPMVLAGIGLMVWGARHRQA
jgi:phosphatidylglycerol:prolipoprotein diacylglycerol transferase